MMWNGVSDEATPYFFIVEDYFNKKLLAKLGYKFDSIHLTDFQVEAYNVIAVEVDKLERADLERQNRMRGKNGK